MDIHNIILLDGSKHKTISEAVEYLVKKELAQFEKRISELEDIISRYEPLRC